MDMTHGGDILAEEYLARGAEVVCADVYGTADPAAMRALAERGAEVSKEVPPGRYDLALSPAHCPARFAEGAEPSESKSFSEAVGDLIRDRRFRVEITGMKGKTSACYVLAHILDAAGRRVFLHTSRGQGPYSGGAHRIERRMSIAPTSLLRLPPGGYDAIVAECSLGGSGKADIAAVTNLPEDYGIAQGTRRASDAKAQILTGGVNIVHEREAALWSRYGKPLRAYGGAVSQAGPFRLGEPLAVVAECGGVSRRIELGGSYLSLQYLEAMSLALEICRAMGVPPEAAIEALSSFKGVPGRGEISREGDVTVVRERNPGISRASVRRTLECLRAAGALDGAFAILDPVSRKVCDKLDAGEVSAVAAEFGVGMAIASPGEPRPRAPPGTGVLIEFVKEGFQ
jgi:hypothetical protein